ncbi:tetratricopeptide repeat protein, partial [Brochothrix thermosphacta]|uniref:tetratricopeptide repeat protein n=1 Tax=Brochothrix thermosphacta TaxID=2756 RepID=UPI00083F55C2
NNQNIEYQLRFFTEDYAYNIVNNIVIKIKDELKKIQKIEFNLYKKSVIEDFFIERLCLFNDNVSIKYIKIQIEELCCTLKIFKQYLNKGDNFSAKIIWDSLINSELSNSEKLSFYHISSLMFNSLKNPLAAETMLNYVINNDYLDNDSKIIKVKAMYVLSMNYLRTHPNKLKDLKKAKLILNEAHNIATTELLYLGDQQKFIEIFNRNGYALALFQEGKTTECINILNEKIAMLSEIISEKNTNSHFKLHKTVLMYNLYQCYLKEGMIDSAEKTIKMVIDSDENDIEYKYDLVRFLIEENRFEEALEELDNIKKTNNPDCYSQNSYLGYCYYLLEDYNNSKVFFKKALDYNYEDSKEEEALYNYLLTLEQVMEVDTIQKLKAKYSNKKFEFFNKEIEEIFK